MLPDAVIGHHHTRPRPGSTREGGGHSSTAGGSPRWSSHTVLCRRMPSPTGSPRRSTESEPSPISNKRSERPSLASSDQSTSLVSVSSRGVCLSEAQSACLPVGLNTSKTHTKNSARACVHALAIPRQNSARRSRERASGGVRRGALRKEAATQLLRSGRLNHPLLTRNWIYYIRLFLMSIIVNYSH